MVILLEIVLALALVGLLLGWLLRGRRDAERADITRRRVEAYMQTIRREGGNAELAAMTDDELRDLLLSSAHNLRQQNDRRFWFLLVGLVVVAAAALVVALEHGVPGFGITLAVGAIALYGLNEYFGRRISAPLIARGIDLERLRVE